MRNLKRALSLGLTAAMISGLMVMGTSTASYADVADTDNVEAIEVLEAVGIMIGDENGNFNPDQNVTRNEMAVVMANLMEYNVASYKDTSPFTDVPSWAEPYVAACYTNGITSGYSDTIYGGSDNVTTAQAALMLMKALGYFQYASDFGSDWQLATTRQGNAIDLFIGVDSGVEQAMTRNDVAQLVLNTLEAGTVQANTSGSITIGGVTINTDVQYDYITSNQSYASAINDSRTTNNDGDLVSGYIVELGEQLYMGDLQLEDGTLDDFGRPSRTWSYEGNDIGTYAKRALLQQTYTVEVEGGEVYNDIGATASDYELSYWVDGVSLTDAQIDDEADKLERRNEDAMNSTGTGVLTEVYVDTNEEMTYFVVINTYLAEVATDYRTNTEDILINVYDGTNAGNPPTTASTTYTVEVEDIPEIEDLAEEDMILVRIADDEIVSIDAPEVVSDVEITEYDSDRVNANPYTNYQLVSLTADGTDYDANEKTFWEAEFIYDHETEDLDSATYNLYLDFYGNVIGVEQVDADDNYVFIVGYDRNTSHLAQAVDDALAIFPDGRMEPIDVRDDELEADDNPGWLIADGTGNSNVNRWYTYTMDGDVYVLESYVDRQIIASEDSMNTDVLDRDHSTIQDMNPNRTGAGNNNVAVGNSETVFITVDAGDEVEAVDGSIVDVNGVVTGIQEANVELEYYNDLELYNNERDEMVFAVYDSRGYIEYAVVVGTSASSNDYVYLTSGTENHGYDGSNYYWNYTGITKDGEITFRSYTSEDQNDNQLAAGNLYKMDFNENGEVTRNGAEFVADLTTAQLNTEGYRDAGYALTRINTVQTLYANGLTFQYDIANNNNFIHLDPECTFFVNDSRKDDNDYVEYGTVSAALNALGSDHNFRGTVAALVNSNGFAEVLILDDEYTGNDGGTGIGSGATDYYTYDATVFSNGVARVIVNANRPDWLTTAVDLAYTYDILVNGVVYDTVVANSDAAGQIQDGRDTATTTWSNTWMYPLDSGDVVTVDNFRWTNLDDQTYVVKYIDQNDRELTVGSNADLDSWSDTTLASGSNILRFSLNESKYNVVAAASYTGQADYKVINAYAAGPAAVSGQTGEGTGTATTVALTAGTFDANGTYDLEDYVYVQIEVSDLTELDPTYSVIEGSAMTTAEKAAIGSPGSPTAMSALGIAGATTDTLAINVDQVATLYQYDVVTFTATIVDGTDNVAYNVVVETDQGDVTLNSSGVGYLTMPAGDVTITGIRVSVATPRLAVSSASVSGNELTIRFNTVVACRGGSQQFSAADFNDTLDAASRHGDIVDVQHASESNVVKVIVDSAFVAGNKIVLDDGSATNAVDITDELASVTFEVMTNSNGGLYVDF